jgi:hypothetical protein
MEISIEVPQNLKIELLYDPAIPLLGIYPKEYQSAYNRDTCIPRLSWHYSQYLSYRVSLVAHQWR